MNDLPPAMPREMRCKPPNAQIQHKNVRGNISYFENITSYNKKDLNYGKIRLHINEDKNKTEGQDFVYFIKEELVDFEIDNCEYKNPIVDPGPEVFFDYAILRLRLEMDSMNNGIGNIATNIRLVDNHKKEKKEKKKRIFKIS